jgi:hypothetical protein
MFGLVKAHAPAARQRNRGDRSPAGFHDFSAGDAFRVQRLDFGRQIVAHQIQLMSIIISGGMERRFGGGERENKPSVTGVDGWKSKDIAEEGSVRIRVRGVNHRVSAIDHQTIIN